MHSTVGIAAAAILAIANALPQASSSCVQQPGGISKVTGLTVPTDLSVTAWQQWFGFSGESGGNADFQPQNWDVKFSGLEGAISGGNYLTYEQLESYNVETCASFCKTVENCVAFNIYFERDPAWNGDGCTLTGSAVDDTITNVHCSLWAALENGASYDKSYATNTGQWAVDGTFQVAITGSNAYQLRAKKD